MLKIVFYCNLYKFCLHESLMIRSLSFFVNKPYQPTAQISLKEENM